VKQPVVSPPNAYTTACMIGNNTSIWELFNRTVKQYDYMYNQRAFVHQYTVDMEEGEFPEARENVGFLKLDYQDLISGTQDEDLDWDVEADF